MAISVKAGQNFTQDLEREVLKRLPVQSLLRFKCVCKSWYTLIKSPSFINDQFNHNKNKCRPQLFIHDLCADIDDSVPITVVSEDKIGEIAKLDHDLQGQGFGDLWTLIGSADGLFLLQKGDGDDISLALWNPAIREIRALPGAQFLLPSNDICFTHTPKFGFGLDPLTDNNYKVVWLRFVLKMNTRDELVPGAYAAVYSCSTDSWRTIEPISNEIMGSKNEVVYCIYAHGVAYLNGAYYWLIQRRDRIDKVTYSILSFDFGNEVFREIGGPDINHFDLTSLVLLDDSTIAILNSSADLSVYDIWVQNIQPGAAGVWNKILTFQCPSHIIKSCYHGFWDSSTLIFLTKKKKAGRGSRLVAYDVRTQETRDLGYRQYQGERSGISVYYYKESLVTIKRRGRKMDKGWARRVAEII